MKSVVQQALKGAKGFTPKSFNSTKILKDSYDNDDNAGNTSASTTQHHTISCNILFSQSESDFRVHSFCYFAISVSYIHAHRDLGTARSFACMCCQKRHIYEHTISISNEPISITFYLMIF